MIPQFEQASPIRLAPFCSLPLHILLDILRCTFPSSSAQGPEREQPDTNHQGGFRRTETSACLVSAIILISPFPAPYFAGGRDRQGEGASVVYKLAVIP